MRLTFLGTGTSMGVPVVGCSCAVCTSTDPRNHRLRTSALIETATTTIVIDVGPDFRQQALTNRMQRLDAVVFTHAHADHVAGIDDLRPFNFFQRRAIPLYGHATTLAHIRTRYDYAFIDSSAGSTRPLLELHPITSYMPFQIGDIELIPLDVQHGTWAIHGFRIGNLGYITDASVLDARARSHLQGLDVLVLNTLRHEQHPTHFSVAESLAVVEELHPQQTFFVHMSHDLEHAATNAILPPQVQLAYDGLSITLPDGHTSRVHAGHPHEQSA